MSDGKTKENNREEKRQQQPENISGPAGPGKVLDLIDDQQEKPEDQHIEQQICRRPAKQFDQGWFIRGVLSGFGPPCAHHADADQKCCCKIRINTAGTT